MRLLTTAALGALLSACTTMHPETDTATLSHPDAAEAAIPEATGYFAQESTLPFKAPDFTRIRREDFAAAYRQAMAIEAAEVAAIAQNPEPPTFENTIVALEKTGRMLGRVDRAFSAIAGSDTDDLIDATDAEIAPLLTAHNDAINLDPALFARVKAVYDNRAAMSLLPEDAALLEKRYEQMVHAGALLTAEQKEAVKSINARLSTATTEFAQRLTKAQVDNPLVVGDVAQLAGLSAADIAAAKKEAEKRGMPDKWVLTLTNTTQQPFLAVLEDRATREAFFAEGWTRAVQGDADDTGALVAEIVNLRARKAALFGAPDWASYNMYDRMLESPAQAVGFMREIVPALRATQEREAALIDAAIAAEGKDFTVRPWDWQMYADKVKRERFAFDAETVKPYFEMQRVLEDGVFYAAEKLYGITAERRTDIPTWHEDVWVYTIRDHDGSELGLYYFDPFQRPSKRGGAWNSSFVPQSKLWGEKPVIYNVHNVPKAPEGEPQLLTWDETETLFHEFGHALHNFLSDRTYPSMAGSSVARDFAEYPSQVNEMWASYPEVLANYARHWKTGEALAPETIDKLVASQKWNQGWEFGQTLESALLDMKWHALSPAEAAKVKTTADVNALEAEWLEDLGARVDLVPPRYRTSYFRHIFSSPTGYSAGYYSYVWTEVLDRDSRQWFRENGGLTRANGDHFRETVLSKGGTEDYGAMFRAFAGRDPAVAALLEARGLVEPGADD